MNSSSSNHSSDHSRSNAGAWMGIVATLVLAAMLIVVLQHRVQMRRHAEWGRELFEGRAQSALPPLQGRLVGHENDLPAMATRCINCHSTAAATAAAAASAAFGTPLNASTLARAQPRRGGPPSAYDASSMCRVLREGIDPAFVIISQTMPRYDASNVQCQALWLWLNRPVGG